MPTRILFTFGPPVLAVFMPMCATPAVRPTMPAAEALEKELWQRPADLAERDLFYGPWGREHAPEPDGEYTFVKPKLTGVNPGMTVRDDRGRMWSVKQAPHDDRQAEGPIEVVLSRVLAAVGYHQPPVYYLPLFTLADPFGTRTEPGGRFRLDRPGLKERGQWSWQQNPFVDTRPYQGLLVILTMFNSSDIKNSNNSMYEHRRAPQQIERWFVVRDLGSALGGTARLRPVRGDIDAFERHGFITGVKNGFVQFDYHGFHQELLDQRITPQDVVWASELLADLSEAQWHDAFRAGGFESAIRGRFITRLLAKIDEGRRIGLQVAEPRRSSVPSRKAGSL